MRELGIDPNDTETFVVISGSEALTRSDAAIRLTNHLRGGWRVLRVLRFLQQPEPRRKLVAPHAGWKAS